ncbi:hypothetical protein EYF80_025768 [Liparis tanakae]|uniref:Uncharacterized protein n=1 Tax=Liparis tanakae TaxID=230148 RepID=A0A4Z2HFH4_9TELE|nr:hypothetical protein EYF80_025768 [Liparis tanakae]
MFESPNISETRASIQRVCDRANNNAGVYVYGTALWRLTDLGLLHARLHLHLGYDLVHVGLQHHAPHHHLLQDVMDLQTDATQRLTHRGSVTGTSLLACRLRLNIQSAFADCRIVSEAECKPARAEHRKPRPGPPDLIRALRLYLSACQAVSSSVMSWGNPDPNVCARVAAKQAPNDITK